MRYDKKRVKLHYNTAYRISKRLGVCPQCKVGAKYNTHGKAFCAFHTARFQAIYRKTELPKLEDYVDQMEFYGSIQQDIRKEMYAILSGEEIPVETSTPVPQTPINVPEPTPPPPDPPAIPELPVDELPPPLPQHVVAEKEEPTWYEMSYVNRDYLKTLYIPGTVLDDGVNEGKVAISEIDMYRFEWEKTQGWGGYEI